MSGKNVVERPESGKPVEPLAYDLDAVAHQLGGVTRRYVETLVETGELASFKLGRRRLVDARDLRGFVDALRAEGQRARDAVTDAEHAA
jgi:excisionase family DNA binding protein